MEFLENFGICVTSYEVNTDGSQKPVMTHIFWGKTLDEALRYTKSHLISDLFFSSSYVGKMTWKGDELKLLYTEKIISIVPISNKQQVTKELLDTVRTEVNKIIPLQYQTGMVDIVNRISEMSD